MSALTKPGVERNSRTVEPLDSAEIYGIPTGTLPRPVVRTELRPEEEAVSLSPKAPTGGPLAALIRLLGPALTVANPAWYGDPIPLMRGLQKKLVEHSLTLDEGDRSECMAAISTVEIAVRLRLRFQQLRMTELERNLKPEPEKA
ncbi:hypothetical protein EGT07_13305 [Herbaspirillum sp. HC18]|nr:hypothetical protein EGT07_13305 [Herbaspirillum sp. HC18]